MKVVIKLRALHSSTRQMDAEDRANQVFRLPVMSRGRKAVKTWYMTHLLPKYSSSFDATPWLRSGTPQEQRRLERAALERERAAAAVGD